MNGVYPFVIGGAWGWGASDDEQRAYQLALEGCVKYGSCLPRMHSDNQSLRLRVFDDDQYYDFNRPERVIEP